MKKITLLLLILSISNISFGQDEADTLKPWTVGGLLSLNLSQASFSNWASGGQNSISGNLLFLGRADLKKDKYYWNNAMLLGLGYSRLSELTTKTNDNLEINSLFGKNAFAKNWYYSAIMNFKTQFANGYKDGSSDSTLLSGFMAPGYLNLGLGLNYNLNDVFSVNIAPANAKMIFVQDQILANRGEYGVTPAVYDENGNLVSAGENMNFKFGMYIRTAYNYEIFKNVNLLTTLDLFSNYLEKPENIDVNWTVLLGFKVNDWLTASINTTLIYDADVTFEDSEGQIYGPAVQFKEIFNIGLAFNFGDKFEE